MKDYAIRLTHPDIYPGYIGGNMESNKSDKSDVFKYTQLVINMLELWQSTPNKFSISEQIQRIVIQLDEYDNNSSEIGNFTEWAGESGQYDSYDGFISELGALMLRRMHYNPDELVASIQEVILSPGLEDNVVEIMQQAGFARIAYSIRSARNDSFNESDTEQMAMQPPTSLLMQPRQGSRRNEEELGKYEEEKYEADGSIHFKVPTPIITNAQRFRSNTPTIPDMQQALQSPKQPIQPPVEIIQPRRRTAVVPPQARNRGVFKITYKLGKKELRYNRHR